MAYTIYKADGTSVVVPDNIIDTDYYNPTGGDGGVGLGTQLIGRNTINYGAPIAQNFLQMTENFSSGVVPDDTTSLQGQLWFNKLSSVDGNLYVRISGAVSGDIANWRKLIIDDGSGFITGDVTGNAGTATALETPRTISATGDATWTVTFDGTTNATGALTLATVNANVGSYGSSTLIPIVTVDGKGRITAISTVAAAGGGGGSGTVTSIQVAGGTTGLIFTSNTTDPITTTGTYTMSGTVGLNNGGTGAVGATAGRTALGAAKSGANTDITSLTNLTTPLGLIYGGTGGITDTAARATLNAAKTGANSDITSLSALSTALSIPQGGTGQTTAGAARTALGAAASGANVDITSITGLSTPLATSMGGTASAVAVLFGIGQTWASYIGSRTPGATITYSGTRPMMVSATGIPGAGGNYFTLECDTGGGWIVVANSQSAGTEVLYLLGVIPPGATYRITLSGVTLSTWSELR